MNDRYDFHPGDVISVRFGGVLRHYGVVTLGGRVISNTRKYGGVVEQSISEFADGRPVKRHRAYSDRHHLEVEARARRAKGARYDLTGSNCIDFVRWTHRRKPSPWQVGSATMRTLADLIGPKRR